MRMGAQPEVGLPQPAGLDVTAVVCVGRSLWAAVGDELIVWGARLGERGG